ncbi:MAG: T9SS type A sorting domain-containing protein, partial [Bacteroidales bacterium]|nr:T9SS type A sorting domain-containing protein [Bacteroidales bacterium]
IYVYDQVNNPEIGDSVSLQGQVTEYNGMTEIKTVTNFTRYAIDGIVAPATLLSAAEANVENYESCLITINNAECTEANLAFGEWKINDGTATFTCKDAGGFTFQEVVGTEYRITGVIDFYNYFRLNYRIESDIIDISNVDSEFANSISLYPNPASDQVIVNVPMGAKRITISNTLGQTVAELSVSAETTVINTENYEAGVYFVKIVNNTDSAVLRLVIE